MAIVEDSSTPSLDNNKILDESRGPDLYADQGRWSSDGVCFRWADNNSGGDDYHYCQNPTMVGFWLVGIRWGTMTDDDDDDDYKSDGVCFRLQITEAPLSDRMTPPVVEPNVVQLWRHF